MLIFCTIGGVIVKKNKVRREDIVKLVAKNIDYSQAEVREVYDEIEKQIINLIKTTTTKDNEAYIEIFKGFNLFGVFVKGHNHTCNLNGKKSVIPDKIRLKIKPTVTFEKDHLEL